MLHQATFKALDTLHLEDLERGTANIQQCALLESKDTNQGSMVTFLSKKKISALLLSGKLVSLMILVDKEKLTNQIKKEEVSNG